MSPPARSAASPAPFRRRRPRGLVLTRPQERAAEIDWSSWELDEVVEMTQSPDHDRDASEFESSLRRLFAEDGIENAFVCKDSAFGWMPDRPKVQVSPDVYVVFDALTPPPDSWQTWEPGHKPPAFALEIVSKDRTKEYVVNPDKYASLGAEELVIYDPTRLGKRPRSGRPPALLRYARAEDGAFELREESDVVVHSEVLRAWLVLCPGPFTRPRLRLARDPVGRRIVPTLEEHAARETAEKERERSEKEAAVAAKDAALADRDAALAELERLRAELKANTSHR